GARLSGRILLSFILTFLLGASLLEAQPVVDDGGDVGIGTSIPHPSSILDLTSTRGGFLFPRMNTAQRDGIVMPALGLMIYNTDDGTPQIWSDASGTPKWDSLVTTGSNYGW